MKNNNIEQTILRTIRAGIEDIEELTEELRNEEAEEAVNFSRRIDMDPNKIMKEAYNE